MSTEATEKHRLDEAHANRAAWMKWQYPCELQWDCEDYSDNGETWNYLPLHRVRLRACRACRAGEDGLAGISDDQQTRRSPWRCGAAAGPRTARHRSSGTTSTGATCCTTSNTSTATGVGIGANHHAGGTCCVARVIQFNAVSTRDLLRMRSAEAAAARALHGTERNSAMPRGKQRRSNPV
ncbi:hypothetical protein [Variovorax saccharolyticus]|uniref:hypothetical protein n=1 Tax=Variovorax saccharolyticus TaxID=3053516 RepID=UPI0025749A6B|nr:hypothetical protein [Variovorax sp. J22R187]MDM0022388.1 hypothetical protein [Variovorax sp. J22R187]